MAAAARSPAPAGPVPALGSSAEPAASTSSPRPAASTGAWLRRMAADSPRPLLDSARCTANRYPVSAAPSSAVCHGRAGCSASSASTASVLASAQGTRRSVSRLQAPSRATGPG